MGMGAAKKPVQTGVAGKGGVARPATPTAPQPVAGMGGKGVSQQPVQRPGMQLTQPQLDIVNSGGTAGLNGKGGAQPVQPGMGGKGLGQQPTYPFPQPQVPLPQLDDTPQLQPGMGGKGVGTRQIDPTIMDTFVPQIQPAPVQQPVAGMGGKGVGAGQLDPTRLDYIRSALTGAQPQQVQQPAPAPAPAVQPKGNLSSALAGLRTPVPVQPAPKQQAAQRALQQLALRNRGRR